MPKGLDIAVAGAGPAGLAAALSLHRDGHRVSIFERFETARPIGSGLILQPTGQAVLAELGLWETIKALGQPLDRLAGTDAKSGRTVLDMRYAALKGLGRGLGVHRTALFNVLHEAVVANEIPLSTGMRVTGRDGGHLLLDGRREGPFDLVVDALGANSPLRPLLDEQGPTRPLAFGAIWGTVPWIDKGFDATALTQRYEGASVMIGVLPIGRQAADGPTLASFFWSLKWMDHQALLDGGFEAWRERVLSLWPETAPHLEALNAFGALSLARYAHHTAAVPFGERLVAVGDAAHSTSPQLGQGANMALLDARALTLALRMADPGAALQTYAWLRRGHVRLYQALSLMLTPFYQSESRALPVLRDILVPIATTVPPLPQVLAALVAGRLLDPLKRLRLEAVRL
ncbi:MAG: NAD(P)/FAD-dependent oxidoreductase [Devosia sp.]|nr:NAD(P)/FAD-dependent oxidoreductase [Devosia sp.]